MRRNILIALNSAYLFMAALVIGVPVGIGAIMAPIVFHTAGVDRALAGQILSKGFEATGILSNLALSVMLALAAFEITYRRRLNTRRLLVARFGVNIVALLLSLYMSEQLLPMLKDRQKLGDRLAFAQMHSTYQKFYWAAILLCVVLVVLTQAINIGPRRAGGHPREV